jgi:protein tyrosine/serine phosphatase
MPFTNLDNRHFNAAEKLAVKTALTALESAVTTKLANLTAEERQKYGSVNEQNKLVINKVKDYHDAQPALSSPDIDWVEFNNDYDSRAFIQTTLQQLQGLLIGLENAKILHDYDNFTAALTDYDYAKYKASTQANGFQPKVDELAQFFAGRPSGSSEKRSSEEA